MFLGVVAKIAMALAGGTAIVGTPFLAKHLMKREKTIAPPVTDSKKTIDIDVSGKKKCKVLVSSSSENKKIAVCGESVPLEFFYLTGTNTSEAATTSQKIISFFGKEETGSSTDFVKFSLEVTSGETSPKTETIKVSDRSKLLKLQLLKESGLSSCVWDWKLEEVRCTSQSVQGSASSSTSVKLEIRPESK